MDINDGGLVGRGERDFVAGTVPFQVINETGNWIKYAPSGERQWNRRGDSMSCTNFAHLNSVEAQEFCQTGSQPNYSDRWSAKTSGTTPQGNYLYKVSDAIRNIGLVLESDYPTPTGEWTTEDWFTDIPEPLFTQLKLKAGEWKSKWNWAYEWVELTQESFTHHLKQAPLILIKPGHAIAGLALKVENNEVTYLDTYEPYIKTAPLSIFSDALKGVLTSKFKIEPMVFFKIKGKPAIYEFANNAWRGYDDLESYQRDVTGKEIKILELDEVEFKKLPELRPI